MAAASVVPAAVAQRRAAGDQIAPARATTRTAIVPGNTVSFVPAANAKAIPTDHPPATGPRPIHGEEAQGADREEHPRHRLEIGHPAVVQDERGRSVGDRRHERWHVAEGAPKPSPEHADRDGDTPDVDQPRLHDPDAEQAEDDGVDDREWEGHEPQGPFVRRGRPEQRPVPGVLDGPRFVRERAIAGGDAADRIDVRERDEQHQDDEDRDRNGDHGGSRSPRHGAGETRAIL